MRRDAGIENPWILFSLWHQQIKRRGSHLDVQINLNCFMIFCNWFHTAVYFYNKLIAPNLCSKITFWYVTCSSVNCRDLWFAFPTMQGKDQQPQGAATWETWGSCLSIDFAALHLEQTLRCKLRNACSIPDGIYEIYLILPAALLTWRLLCL